MPKAVGSPITLTAAQPMREVTQFTVNVQYVNGVAVLFAHGYGALRTRDVSGNVVIDSPAQEIGAFSDSQITGPIRTAFLNAIGVLDTL